MPSPGWYPDPQDPTGLRWFDGDNWTDYLQPGAGAVAAPEQPSHQAVHDPYAARGYDPYAAQSGYGTPAQLAATTALSGSAGGPPGGVSGGVSGGISGGTAFAPGSPAAVPPAVPPGAAYGPSYGAPTPHSRQPNTNRTILVIAAVVLIVAALVTGGLLLLGGGGGATFTYGGKKIEQPAVTLTAAEDNLRTIVAQRKGNENDTTRCYYAIPADPGTAKKTDVDHALRCGPVLFIGGTAGNAYLSFDLTPTDSGSGVSLAPAGAPESNTPAGLPTGFTIKRPDGKEPPTDNGGLQVPQPPAAESDVVTSSPAVTPVPTAASAATAYIGSINGGIAISDFGKITGYGTGDDARSAPNGQQLYAFKLTGAAGNSGTVKDLSAETTLSVNGASGQTLPAAGAGQYIVIAAPKTASSLDLVLNDASIRQTFSLLTATLGDGNIKVLARQHRDLTVNQKITVTLNYSAAVQFADKTTGQTQTATVALSGVSLAYTDTANNYNAGGPDKAILIPDIVYTGSHDGGPYGLDTSLLTFTPAGATVAITAVNISTDKSKIRNVFDVPADVTSGMLTIRGKATEKYSNSTNTYVISVASPMSFQIAFQPG